MKSRLFLYTTAVFLPIAITLMALLAFSAPAQATPAAPTNQDDLLCRFGVNVVDSASVARLPDIGAGWYMDFTTRNNPFRPDGVEYMPVIRFRPEGNDSYTYQPSGSALQQAIADNPGAKWLISNEPDSTQQDDLKPAVYARAYHELYHLLKTADPTAQVIAGSIIQATPLRLYYLDQMLLSYQSQFQTPLPTDGWNIHNYILNEASCSAFPANCWGAGIPPGVNWTHGELWGLKDTDRVDIFIARVQRFRQWMADRGYRGLPLHLTEYGVLFPEDYLDENGNAFPPARVNAFMNATYDYMRTAVHPTLGNPHDKYRLVQQWAWYSSTDTRYNGVLFDSGNAYNPTAIGANFASYTAPIVREHDFYPTAVRPSAFSALSQGEPVTVTLSVQVANSGNLVLPAAASAQFYLGNPNSGGIPLGPPQEVSLSGCGQVQTLTLVWPDVAPGVYTIYVLVTPGEGVVDANLSNNLAMGQLVVGTRHLFLPLIQNAIRW
jgi:hypothetical protein